MSNSEISWQSAYFGLVGIALNTMTQPAGRVYGFSAASSFFIRASPVVCAIDTLQTLAQLTLCPWRSKSLCEGIAYVTNELYEDEKIEAGEEGPLTTLRKTRATRWIVFGLTGVTQIVKLLACSGIPWTNVRVMAYTISWLAVEILALFATRKQLETFRYHDRPQGWSFHQKWKTVTFAKWLGWLDVLAQFTLATTAMLRAYAGASWFPDHESETGLSKSGRIFAKIMWMPTQGALTSFAFWTIAVLPLSVIATCIGAEDFTSKILALCGTAAGVFRQVACWKYDFIFVHKRAPAGTLFFGILSHCSIWMIIFYLVAESKHLSMDTVFRFRFFFITCFGAFSYYVTIYDSTGTQNPDLVYLLG